MHYTHTHHFKLVVDGGEETSRVSHAVAHAIKQHMLRIDLILDVLSRLQIVVCTRLHWPKFVS
jgi:hypothetical protein